MVGLHVVDDEVLNRLFANNGLNLGDELLEEADINGIYQGHHLVVNQVRVVRHTVGQGPQAFKEVLVAVVHPNVMDLSFDQ